MLPQELVRGRGNATALVVLMPWVPTATAGAVALCVVRAHDLMVVAKLEQGFWSKAMHIDVV